MKRKLLINSGWLAIGSALGRAGVVLSSVLVARWLGKDQFGLVAIAQSTVLMFGGFLGVGFGMTATKILAAERAKQKPWPVQELSLLSWCNSSLAAVAALIMVCFRSQISEATVGSADLAGLLLPAAWLLVVTAINFYQAGLLTGQENFQGAAIANGLSSIITIPAILLGVQFAGAVGAIWGHALGMTLSCAVFRRTIAATVPSGLAVSFLPNFHYAKAMLWRDALPNVLLSWANAPVDWLCLAMLVHASAGTGEAAIFSACNQWCLLLRFLPMTIATALLPAVAHASASGQATRSLISFALVANGLFAAVLALLFSLASPWIMACYGPEFASGSTVLILLMVAGAAIAVQLAADRVLTALDYVWPAFWINAIRGLAYIAMAGGLVTYGAVGLAIARCVTSVLHCVVAAGAAYSVAARQDHHHRQIPLEVPTGLPPNMSPVRAA